MLASPLVYRSRLVGAVLPYTNETCELPESSFLPTFRKANCPGTSLPVDVPGRIRLSSRRRVSASCAIHLIFADQATPDGWAFLILSWRCDGGP